MRKRIFDLVLLAPLLPLVAAVVAALALVGIAAHGRPVFFRQVRLGRGRRPFTIWKLRTRLAVASMERASR